MWPAAPESRDKHQFLRMYALPKRVRERFGSSAITSEETEVVSPWTTGCRISRGQQPV